MSVEAFLWPLALAAISGITYLAYAHPKHFKNNIAYPIGVFTVGVAATIFVFSFVDMDIAIRGIVKETSALAGENALLELDLKKLQTAFYAQLWAAGVSVCIVLYLLFLCNLPKKLGLSTDKEADKEP